MKKSFFSYYHKPKSNLNLHFHSSSVAFYFFWIILSEVVIFTFYFYFYYHLMICRSFWNLVLQFTKWQRSWLNINSIQIKPVIQNQHRMGHTIQNAESITKQLFLHWFKNNEAINFKHWDPQKWKPPFYLHLLQLLCSLDGKSFNSPKPKEYKGTNPKQNGNLPSFLTTVYQKNNPKYVTEQTQQILHFLTKQKEPNNQYLWGTRLAETPL